MSTNDINMAEDSPAPDLERSLVLGNSWLKHLQSPSLVASSNDMAHIKDVLKHGTDEYVKLSNAYFEVSACTVKLEDAFMEVSQRADHYQKLYEQTMRAQTHTQPHTLNVPASFTNLPFREGNTWKPKPPGFSDPCLRGEAGKPCRRNQCQYVHKDQEEPYREVIALLQYPNKIAKETAEKAAGEVMEE